MDLKTFFSENPRGAIAFSGGVDSALLVWAAGRFGADWHAYYVRTPFQPAFELEDARTVADLCGMSMTVLDVDILQNETVVKNPENRCYFCKRSIFSAILAQARSDGHSLVIDGSNASDDAADRPGMRALAELEVRSPLRECGLAKADVRALSREAGLPTWNKPAYACLATRIPTNTAITAEALANIEQAESYLMSLGLRDFRVRLRDGALVQVTAEQTALAERCFEAISQRLTPLFGQTTLDKTPREPSL